ncbi:hypothetical protein EMIT0347P_140036 [Pseudomonas sp. IT-347P]|uniref:hypothetical protein n=1 Tax=Pseudomonas sp. IT-347P TaxID=3026458 RepID=UPI0039E11CCD
MVKPPKPASGGTSPGTSPTAATQLADRPQTNRLNFSTPGAETTVAPHTVTDSDSTLPDSSPRQPAVSVSHLPDDDRHFAAGTPPVPEAESLIVEVPVYLAPEDAARLTKPQSPQNAIRYDKHRQPYLDTRAGTVRVRKNAGGKYQLAFASTRASPAIVFEPIPGTTLWQAVSLTERSRPDSHRPLSEPDEPRPDPSKRRKLADAPDGVTHAQTLRDSLLSDNPQALNLSYSLWRNWGTTRWPTSSAWIDIDGLHYPIVRQTLDADTRIVYLQHPLFVPALYDGFEHMLRERPSLQPKWAVKSEDRWIVIDSRVPFERPLSQYIGATFKSLSDESVSTVARAFFNQANRSEVIDGHGLAVMNQTFRYWSDRSNLVGLRPELVEPLLMLRTHPQPDSRSSAPLTIPSALGEGLQRLDFDPGRFPQHWNEYAAAPGLRNLRRLFAQVLEDDGYVMNMASDAVGEDTLLFQRDPIDRAFILKILRGTEATLRRATPPGKEPSDTLWQTLIGTQRRPLHLYAQQQKLVHLLGGIQTDTQGQTTLFIFREG